MTLGKSTALGFILIATSVAWADAPIRNIVDEAVPSRLDGTLRTLDEVKEAIVTGCQRKGWRPVLDGEAQIKCTILVRGRHYAEVVIPYSAESYSILYVTSRELDYNEKKQKIHKNYNRWVLGLSATIQQQFDML
jgi:hypothetical protein